MSDTDRIRAIARAIRISRQFRWPANLREVAHLSPLIVTDAATTDSAKTCAGVNR